MLKTVRPVAVAALATAALALTACAPTDEADTGTDTDIGERSRPSMRALGKPRKGPAFARPTARAVTSAWPDDSEDEPLEPVSASATPIDEEPTNDNPTTNAAAPTRAPFLTNNISATPKPDPGKSSAESRIHRSQREHGHMRLAR